MPEFNIRDITGTNFGSPSPKNFLIDTLVQNVIKPKLFNVEEYFEDPAEATSLLGTSVIGNLEIYPGRYDDLDGNQQTYDGIRIDTVLFRVSMNKNIVQTPIVGRAGTVKEYIADGDFQITAEAIIVGDTIGGVAVKETGLGPYPEDEPIKGIRDIGNRFPNVDFMKFVKIMQSPEKLLIKSSFLEYIFDGKYDVVVEGFEAQQLAGRTNTQLVTIRMLSDTNILFQ